MKFQFYISFYENEIKNIVLLISLLEKIYNINVMKCKFIILLLWNNKYNYNMIC